MLLTRLTEFGVETCGKERFKDWERAGSGCEICDSHDGKDDLFFRIMTLCGLVGRHHHLRKKNYLSIFSREEVIVMAQVSGAETSGSATWALGMIQFVNIKLKVYWNIYNYCGHKISLPDDVLITMWTLNCGGYFGLWLKRKLQAHYKLLFFQAISTSGIRRAATFMNKCLFFSFLHVLL